MFQMLDEQTKPLRRMLLGGVRCDKGGPAGRGAGDARGLTPPGLTLSRPCTPLVGALHAVHAMLRAEWPAERRSGLLNEGAESRAWMRKPSVGN